ncbi:protein ADM2 [Pipistrellus kuhlii]|uniref:Adrenomedullin 2 n=1 Tax=Pipistrellus kuhlii TaxID=59472 RepID=A0A7J7R3C8_PIPKU|nr:protein ADM2 [Pipistrellus kuhlii]KAF6270553.1 adrenomedullin 2 [Pipistrellus kuhlii]
MARLLPVTLGCLSLLCLQLPGTLTRCQGRSRQPARPRAPPARTLASGLQPQHPAPRPVIHKPPQRGARLTPAAGHPLQSGPRRHLSPPRPRAQRLRVGCVLSTCQVQNLSHRLWQLVASAGPRDPAPMDPSSPHSYG